MASDAVPLPSDPLIAEAKQRARRRRFILASIGLVAAGVIALTVSLAASLRPSPALPGALAGHQSPLYTVSTVVAHYGSSRRTLACKTSAWMTDEPGGGCSGVPLAGYDLQRFAGRSYPGGGWGTPILRLVGTWDGRLFHVTSATPTTSGTNESDPNCWAHRSGTVVRVSDKAFTEAFTEVSTRIQLFGGGPCGPTYWFQVAVADHRTVSYLRHRFGSAVLVSGFLQPVSQR
jgi:hypothetical protein